MLRTVLGAQMSSSRGTLVKFTSQAAAVFKTRVSVGTVLVRDQPEAGVSFKKTASSQKHPPAKYSSPNTFNEVDNSVIYPNESSSGLSHMEGCLRVSFGHIKPEQRPQTKDADKQSSSILRLRCTQLPVYRNRVVSA